VLPGVTPGSGPAHLGLVGLDSLSFNIGRGVSEALGIGVVPNPTDNLARGNFCTADDEGTIIDRRAGRIPTHISEQLLALLGDIRVPGCDIELCAVQDHRFVFWLKGNGLDGDVGNTDPGTLGAKPMPAKALTPQAEVNSQTAYRNWFVLDAKWDRARKLPRAEGRPLRLDGLQS
jgi:2,3-bisphosphoglycerate-independent phosphoglycerate mutase